MFTGADHIRVTQPERRCPSCRDEGPLGIILAVKCGRAGNASGLGVDPQRLDRQTGSRLWRKRACEIDRRNGFSA
jgi:hypothetical protein